MKYSILFLLFIILICIIAVIIINSISRYKYSGGSSHKPHLSEAATVCNRMTPSDLYAMSYTISGEGNGLDYSILRQMLKKNGDNNGINWIEKPVSEKVNISFGSFGGFSNKKANKLNLSPEFYKQSASIKNVLDGHSGFINKTELYATIKRLIPNGIKYIPATYTIKEFSMIHSLDKSSLDKGSLGIDNTLGKAFPKGIAILKKNFSCQQKGVRVIESMSDYYKAKKELDIKEDGIISEYITNPLTIDSKKFHLRIYFLLSIISGITRCSAHNEYRILTAKDKYKHGDWLNPDIHISGGHNTDTRYIFPDDLPKMENVDILHKLTPFLDVVCMALASSGVKNYSESNAGYQLYGADVLITSDLNPYLIEINKHPGYGIYGTINGWDEFIDNFSTHFFYFILSNAVFPYFGLCSPPQPHAEFIGNGTLSPFGGILTGKHRCTLIPIGMATDSELFTIKKMNFYSAISYDSIYKECAPYNIFLIGYGRDNPFEKRLYPKNGRDAYANGHNTIIGFIGITFESYIKIAIIEEYQNRGIATAMIAQLMEIQYARHYSSPHIPTIIIKEKNKFLNNISNKLHFTYNKNKREFERKCKINDPIIRKIIENKVLTYKLMIDNKIMEKKDIIPPHMVESNSQFVHLLYHIFSNDQQDKKDSTGTRYSKDFIYQGAELKSSLLAKQLRNIILIKKYVYSSDILSNITIFDKKINEGYKEGALYNICDEYYNVKTVDEKTLQPLIKNALFIEEYNPPFLIDNKLMILRHYLLIYISGNNVVKYYSYDKNKVIIDNTEYKIMDIHRYLYPSVNNKYIFPDSFKTGKLSEIANNSSILENFIKELIEIIDHMKLSVHSESNSGFLNICLEIKFTQKNSNFIPILHNIWNYATAPTSMAMTYYHWVQNCVINPHFGFHHHHITPVLCSVRNPISKDIDSNIIGDLSLEFNQNRDIVQVFYSEKKIGAIHLNIANIGVIELKKIEISSTNFKITTFYVNIIFILMDILAAYYAPNIPQLILSADHDTFAHAAYELQFFKGHPFENNKKEYFMRKCR